MREIKFRYRYTDGKDWLFSVFTLAEICNGEPFEFLSDNPLLKRFKHVGQDQFTGLTDKNGVQIYEGDVMTFESQVGKKTQPFWVVEYSPEKGFKSWHSSLNDAIIIGNIYEHPHLLT